MAAKETRTDALIRRLKNHPKLAPVIVGAVVIAAVVVFIGELDDARKRFWPFENQPAVASSDAKDRTEPTRPTGKESRVFAHCQIGVMPSVVPPEGRIHVLITMELPAESGGGGLADYFAQPGTEWKWNNNRLPSWAYRCELTNYSENVLFNLSIPVRLTFRTPMLVPGQENARRQGDITLDRDWVFSVPKLDPSPAAPYVFYIWNRRVQKFVQVRLPEFASTNNGNVPLIQSEGNLVQALNPDPFN